jgi:hypothetical protein
MSDSQPTNEPKPGLWPKQYDLILQRTAWITTISYGAIALFTNLILPYWQLFVAVPIGLFAVLELYRGLKYKDHFLKASHQAQYTTNMVVAIAQAAFCFGHESDYHIALAVEWFVIAVMWYGLLQWASTYQFTTLWDTLDTIGTTQGTLADNQRTFLKTQGKLIDNLETITNNQHDMAKLQELMTKNSQLDMKLKELETTPAPKRAKSRV